MRAWHWPRWPVVICSVSSTLWAVLTLNMFIKVLKPRQNIRHFPILAAYVLISFLFVFFLVYNSTVKQSTKKIEPGQSRTWKDLLVSLFNPRKIFTIRQDLPKRLNFAYFWARTRIVQRGCMVRTLVCFTNTMHLFDLWLFKPVLALQCCVRKSVIFI